MQVSRLSVEAYKKQQDFNKAADGLAELSLSRTKTTSRSRKGAKENNKVKSFDALMPAKIVASVDAKTGEKKQVATKPQKPLFLVFSDYWTPE